MLATKQIVIVEVISHLSRRLARTVADQGWNAIGLCASDGSSADMFDTYHPDLVLIDLHLEPPVVSRLTSACIRRGVCVMVF